MELLEELDIIEKVSSPTSWINHFVAMEKPDGDIRICLDMRQANRAILKKKHPIPTVEETLQEKLKKLNRHQYKIPHCSKLLPQEIKLSVRYYVQSLI